LIEVASEFELPPSIPFKTAAMSSNVEGGTMSGKKFFA